MLFFIEVGSRRVWLTGMTAHPTGDWVTQQACNVIDVMDQRGFVGRHLVRDRDARFSRSLDDVRRAIGAAIIPTPLRTPLANAFAERWVGIVRRECLDHLLIVNRGHAERVVKTFVHHYSCRRPHRGLGKRAPDDGPGVAARPATITSLRRHDVLGRLIHEYELVAASRSTFGTPQDTLPRCCRRL